MKIFLDTANLKEIRELKIFGVIDGVTTNPSLILKEGRGLAEIIEEICFLVDGPVSVEVVASDYEKMVFEGESVGQIASNICIKLPITPDGLRACKKLSEKGYKTNMTLCFTANQALLVAKAGASFVSPFIGRLDDISINGLKLIEEIRTIYDNYALKTEILAASIRTVNHLKQVALMRADIATVPATILKQAIKHPLTDKGLEIFLSDWKKTGQKIRDTYQKEE